MTTLDPTTPGYQTLLAFADDEHMIGARHTSWIGLGPFLEEDLTFCSIAQDELGHAIALYEFLTDEIDQFALLRLPAEYRSCWLAEVECSAWADALVRHWLYDEAEAIRWRSLMDSTVPGLSDLARQAERDEAFHRDHASAYMKRLAEQPTAIDHVWSALDRLAPLADAMFEAAPDEGAALAAGVTAASSNELGAEFRVVINREASALGLTARWDGEGHPPADHRRHRARGTADFLASLREVIMIEPTATW